MLVPKESFEQEMLAKRLDLKWYKFSAIRNESDTHSFYKGKIRKLSWCRPWIPDFLIILKKWALLFIELKRQRKTWKTWKLISSPSVISDEQKDWNKSLNIIDNVACFFTFWYKERIEIIEDQEK